MLENASCQAPSFVEVEIVCVGGFGFVVLWGLGGVFLFLKEGYFLHLH